MKLLNKINSFHDICLEEQTDCATIYFKHIFYTNFDPKNKGRHRCLSSGYWCWSNFFQYPLDIFGYFKHKLKFLKPIK
jgi:hypothetical protein